MVAAERRAEELEARVRELEAQLQAASGAGGLGRQECTVRQRGLSRVDREE
jgi:hypothetical protein